VSVLSVTVIGNIAFDSLIRANISELRGGRPLPYAGGGARAAVSHKRRREHADVSTTTSLAYYPSISLGVHARHATVSKDKAAMLYMLSPFAFLTKCTYVYALC
jgi:hypothetical protein